MHLTENINLENNFNSEFWFLLGLAVRRCVFGGWIKLDGHLFFVIFKLSLNLHALC